MTNPRPSALPENPPSRTGLSGGLVALLGGMLRLAAGLLAFVLMLGALLVGAALALGLVAWALLRGRRPQAQIFSRSFARMRPGQGSAARSSAPGAVVDVEVREVPDDGRPTSPLRPGA